VDNISTSDLSLAAEHASAAFFFEQSATIFPRQHPKNYRQPGFNNRRSISSYPA
jgi:hypothetical protein